MYSLIYENVRCFAGRHETPVRPLTLLVGENSSGKTTFLALNRILHSLFTRSPYSPDFFNEPPFLLGAFDQIANAPLTRSRRAQFLLGAKLEKGTVEWTFRSHQGQPKIVHEEPSLLGTMSNLNTRVNLGYKIMFELAIAPVRSSPQRTYDPVRSEWQPEGSHTPMTLARLARGNKKQWDALRKFLGDYGAGSGLFDAVEIVRKGRLESDPFQVGIKKGGRVFNLLDVGYGVSQILPVLLDCFEMGPGALLLLQQPEVHLHPKAQAELGSLFARLVKNERQTLLIETHSDYIVDRVRLEVRKGTLKPSDVALLYFEKERNKAKAHMLELDRSGDIQDPPPGYRQFFLDEQREILFG